MPRAAPLNALHGGCKYCSKPGDQPNQVAGRQSGHPPSDSSSSITFVRIMRTRCRMSASGICGQGQAGMLVRRTLEVQARRAGCRGRGSRDASAGQPTGAAAADAARVAASHPRQPGQRRHRREQRVELLYLGGKLVCRSRCGCLLVPAFLLHTESEVRWQGMAGCCETLERMRRRPLLRQQRVLALPLGWPPMYGPR